MPAARIGLFGGSFDPVHCGHVVIALAVAERLSLKRVHILPCSEHALGKSLSAGHHRVAMLQIALAGHAQLYLDPRELNRQGLSYTVDTCLEMRSEYGAEVQLNLLVGSDILSHLHLWHRWRELLEWVNLVIVERSADTLVPNTHSVGVPSAEVASLLQNAVVASEKTYGDVLRVSLPDYPFSSSSIRSLLAEPSNRLAGGQIGDVLARQLSAVLPDGVLDYIVKNRLYSRRGR